MEQILENSCLLFLNKFAFSRSELDSELLDDRSTVLGVLTADDKGLCLLGETNVLPMGT